MKLLYDFFPIILFFIAFKLKGIYLATIVAIIASLVQLGVFWLKNRRFEKMHLVSGFLIVSLGGLTLLMQDKAFIMWKPTLINWLFALIFLASVWIGSKPLIERMLSSRIALPRLVWKNLNHAWVVFFIFSGFANLYFAQDYLASENALRLAVPAMTDSDLETFDCQSDLYRPNYQSLCQLTANKEALWVNFKLFGLLGLTVLFVIGQSLYLARHIKPAEKSAEQTTNDERGE